MTSETTNEEKQLKQEKAGLEKKLDELKSIAQKLNQKKEKAKKLKEDLEIKKLQDGVENRTAEIDAMMAEIEKKPVILSAEEELAGLLNEMPMENMEDNKKLYEFLIKESADFPDVILFAQRQSEKIIKIEELQAKLAGTATVENPETVLVEEPIQEVKEAETVTPANEPIEETPPELEVQTEKPTETVVVNPETLESTEQLSETESTENLENQTEQPPEKSNEEIVQETREKVLGVYEKTEGENTPGISPEKKAEFIEFTEKNISKGKIGENVKINSNGDFGVEITLFKSGTWPFKTKKYMVMLWEKNSAGKLERDFENEKSKIYTDMDSAVNYANKLLELIWNEETAWTRLENLKNNVSVGTGETEKYIIERPKERKEIITIEDVPTYMAGDAGGFSTFTEQTDKEAKAGYYNIHDNRHLFDRTDKKSDTEIIRKNDIESKVRAHWKEVGWNEKEFHIPDEDKKNLYDVLHLYLKAYGPRGRSVTTIGIKIPEGVDPTPFMQQLAKDVYEADDKIGALYFPDRVLRETSWNEFKKRQSALKIFAQEQFIKYANEQILRAVQSENKETITSASEPIPEVEEENIEKVFQEEKKKISLEEQSFVEINPENIDGKLFSIPESDGSFIMNRTSPEKYQCYYKIDKKGNVYLINNENIKRAFNRWETYLKPLWEIKNFGLHYEKDKANGVIIKKLPKIDPTNGQLIEKGTLELTEQKGIFYKIEK